MYQITWYGLCYVISFGLIQYLLIINTYSRISPAEIARMCKVCLISGIISGRITSCALDKLHYGEEFWLNLTCGGMAFQGGLIGGIFSVMLYLFLAKKFYLTEYILNKIAELIPIGIGIGRFGNFMNDEFMYSSIFQMPMCIFSALTEGLCLFIFIRFCKIFEIKPLESFLLGYSVIRFCNDFLRQEPVLYFHLKFSQMFCIIIVLLLGLYKFFQNKNSKK